MKLSNHNLQLVPSTAVGGTVLEFDFSSLEIGVATYTEGPTGCTVFHFPKRARFAADVRGGSPGTLLVGQWETLVDPLHAICFTGGSIYGLESVTGVYSELHKRLEYDTAWDNLACVCGAVIYDFHSSMARAIQPFHTSSDGDVLFAVSTEEVQKADIDEVSLGVIGADLAWDAVLNCY